MKFNLKAIAAAAVLAASGSSFAQIQIPSSANPDLYFAAFDFGAQVGFVLDTNIGWNGLTTTPFNFSYDLDTSAAWNTFKTTAQANSASTGIQWGVYAAKTGTDQGFLVGNNAATSSPVLAATNASGTRTGITTVGNFANTLGNSDNGVFVGGPNVAATISANGDFATRLSWDSTELYSASAASAQNLFKYTIAANQTNLLVGTAGIDTNNVLTVAAVPEPGTYALMFAGLFAMGAVVRRRNRG